MPPTTKTLAKLNKLNYKIVSGTKKDKAQALAKVDKIGYNVESTKRGISHFSSKDNNDKHHAIILKGTDPSKTKDLLSDVHLAIGKSKTDKQFVRRKNEIKKIYSKIDNNEDKFLSGHSLGSSIALNAMVRSKSIRDNTKSAVLFNAGMTPSFHAELSKGLSKDDKKELKAKIVHHHAKGDLISASLTDKAIGRVKTVKKTAASSHSLDNFILEKPESVAVEEQSSD
jgi:hypothetical protein